MWGGRAFVSVTPIATGQYVVALCSVVLIIACGLAHYEVLRPLSDWLSLMRKLHRTRVPVLIVGLLTTNLKFPRIREQGGRSTFRKDCKDATNTSYL